MYLLREHGKHINVDTMRADNGDTAVLHANVSFLDLI